MIYDCKLVIENNKYSFNINIKYRLKNSIGFYKKYYILEQKYPSVCDILLMEKLTDFNKLSMEDIKEMLIKHIKSEQKVETSNNMKEKDLQRLIQLSKEKAKKFTVEI